MMTANQRVMMEALGHRTAVNSASSPPPQGTIAKTSVFTIISLNYGAFARTLMESLRTTHSRGGLLRSDCRPKRHAERYRRASSSRP